MATVRQSQPHRVQWPLTATQVEHVDEMLAILFKQNRELLDALNALTLTTGSSSGASSSSASGLQIGIDGQDGQDGLPGLPGRDGAPGLGLLGPPGLDGLDGMDGISLGTPPAPIIQVTTSTGTQNDFALLSGVGMLVCNNASALTITGMTAGLPNQVLRIYSVNAQVDLSHASGSSAAANRLANFATSGVTSLAAGVGIATYVYDASSTKWRLTSHYQGDFIDVAYNAANFSTTGGSGTTWTVDAGDQKTYMYYLSGRMLTVVAYLDSTSISSTAAVQLFVAIPNYTSSSRIVQSNAAAFDNGVGTTSYNRVAVVGTTSIEVGRADVTAWANSTNNTFIRVHITFPVT